MELKIAQCANEIKNILHINDGVILPLAYRTNYISTLIVTNLNNFYEINEKYKKIILHGSIGFLYFFSFK